MNIVDNYEKTAHDFIDAIFEMRKNKRITQDEIAEKIGTKKSNISRIENGKQLNLTIEMMTKLTEAVGGKLFISANGNNMIELDDESIKKLNYIADSIEKNSSDVLFDLITREYRNIAEGVSLSFTQSFDRTEVYDDITIDIPELLIGG